jgi:transposase
MARFDLTDAEWAIIAPLLPSAQDRPRGGRPTENDRRVLNGIFFVLRTGTPWRDLPGRYGPYTSVYNRFRTRQELPRRHPHHRHPPLGSVCVHDLSAFGARPLETTRKLPEAIRRPGFWP